MVNQTDGAPHFQSGDELTPELLNRLADAVARRFVAQPPIYVRAAARQIVIGFDGPNGKPFYYNTVPAKIASADPLKVDLYEDGYPPKTATKTSVDATAIDDTATFVADQRVAVFFCRGLYYVISGAGGSGSGESPAKIRTVVSPTVYKVDLYDDDYSNPITKPNLTAEVIDLNSVPFLVGDQVSVFLDHSKLLDADKYYISTTKPWVPNAMPPTWDAKITASLGSGSYQVRQVVAPGGAFVPGGPTFTVIESVLSPLVGVGTYVEVDSVGTGYRIRFPLGDGS